MKNIIKKFYTLIFHIPLIVKGLKIKKNTFLGRKTIVNKCQYLDIDNNVRIGNNFKVRFYDEFYGEKYSPYIHIEEECYFGDNIKILCTDKITIGKNTLFASDILITTENHSTDPEVNVPYRKQKLKSAPVTIGQNCWIGEKVIILPGVTIGDNSVVAAASVVTKNIDGNCIVAGNPAKVIKRYDFESHKWKRVN